MGMRSSQVLKRLVVEERLTKILVEVRSTKRREEK